jgi:predicted DNA-binding transcriptional regulator AlpA
LEKPQYKAKSQGSGMGPSKDKQLAGTSLKDAKRKQKQDHALNAKELAILCGVSYSTTRQWLKQPSFPQINNLVFWSDFLLWRRRNIPEIEVDNATKTHTINKGFKPI